MMYWNGQMGVWGWIFMGLSFVLFWGAVITGIVLLVRAMRGSGPRSGGYGGGQPGWDQPGWGPGAGVQGPHAGPGPEQILADRFARGEIDEAEYRSRLDVLKQHRSGT